MEFFSHFRTDDIPNIVEEFLSFAYNTEEKTTKTKEQLKEFIPKFQQILIEKIDDAERRVANGRDSRNNCQDR